MKSYVGKKTCAGPNDIYVINDSVKTLLDPKPSQLLYNHSPDGFNWGFPGSGPSQAALGILLDLLGRTPSLAYYQAFKFDKVSKWGNSFCISEGEIKAWLKQTQGS
ncbi:hypothetical protein ES703_11883 [subsurface metagenome]